MTTNRPRANARTAGLPNDLADVMCWPITAHMAIRLADGDKQAARQLHRVSQDAEGRSFLRSDRHTALRTAWVMRCLLTPCCDDHAPTPADATRILRNLFDQPAAERAEASRLMKGPA